MQKNTTGTVKRLRHTVQGRVQGVGFRPYVFRLAAQCTLTGFVKNSSEGVVIEVQGPPTQVDKFAEALVADLPVLAEITALRTDEAPPLPNEQHFSIEETEGDTSGHSVLVSPDMATCDDCLHDIFTPGSRRYLYPFTNCTNCGPRYSITATMPYDRATTSMACFEMCHDCSNEYNNPHDRRFHAQPNACPACGPGLWFIPPNLTERLRAAFTRTDANLEPFYGKEELLHALAQPEEANIAKALLAASKKAASCSGGTPVIGQQTTKTLAHFLLDGGIAAVKGLSGFHLVCNAFDEKTVTLLRERKNRPHKPFALMVDSIASARRLAQLSPHESTLLQSKERPIVLCRISEEGKRLLAKNISPDTACIGIMLPYTPLHHILLRQFAGLLQQKHTLEHIAEARPEKTVPPRATRSSKASRSLADKMPAALVMTSGNKSGEPICLSNREALVRLISLADAFLFHDRDILVRVDDSVVKAIPFIRQQPPRRHEAHTRTGKQKKDTYADSVLFFRRARGFVPSPLLLPEEATSAQLHAQQKKQRNILAVGADLKNTLCITRGKEAFVSQHIGDLKNFGCARFHQETREHLLRLLGVDAANIDLVVSDAHPDFTSTRMAESMGKPLARLWHHGAHAFAVMAENEVKEPALVLTLDGTGLGENNQLWGGEAFIVHAQTASLLRVGRFAEIPLPGGEKAINEPWRIAHALLLTLGLLPDDSKFLNFLPWGKGHEEIINNLPTLLAKKLNCPSSSSAGRLFDAAAALLGLCNEISYEGQAAIRLEAAQQSEMAENILGKNNRFQPTPIKKNATTKTGSHSLPRLRCPVIAHEKSEDGLFVLDTLTLFSDLFTAAYDGKTTDGNKKLESLFLPPSKVASLAAGFHKALVQGLANMAAMIAQSHSIRLVGMSGGCFLNETLFSGLYSALRKKGLQPFFHKALPPGDGCISYGQAVYGSSLLARE